MSKKHKIFLYDNNYKDLNLVKFKQIVNVQNHNEDDFERNINMMIDHLAKHVGDGFGSVYTIGQHITYRTYDDQIPESLPLIYFLVNYIMMEPWIILKADMKKYEPYDAMQLSTSTLDHMVDVMSYRCRSAITHPGLCEFVKRIKYRLNILCVKLGDRLAYSISNNEFISVIKCSDEARETISCAFDIPKNISPKELEKLTADKTSSLLEIISRRHDLCISNYARNGLFNKSQFREFCVHMTHKPDLEGNTIPYTSNTNVLLGINDINAFMLDARGGRKAELLKLKVSDAGDFERSVSTLMAGMRYVDPNYVCDSRHFRTKKLSSRSVMMENDGRVCTLDKNSNDFYIIDPYNDEHKLLGKTVYMKTPITCTHPKRSEGYICAACYGMLLSTINNVVHVGRLSALNDADEMEQKLLSAKHALVADTSDVNFGDDFEKYFTVDVNTIKFNSYYKELVKADISSYKNLYVEIDQSVVVKNKDGENRHYDRSIPEIVIMNSITNDRIIIREANNIPLYLSPEFNDVFYMQQANTTDDNVLIPIVDLVEADIALFEFNYKNTEIGDSLMKINSIMNKGNSGIDLYETYDDCLDEMIPLFNKGGIKIPDIHLEMLVANLIYDKDIRPIDWSKDDVDYKFYSINKSILSSDSVVASLMFRETNKQIAGAHRTYEKRGTSIYDVFMSDVSGS